MCIGERSPQARYNERFATHFHAAVHLGSMRRTWSGAPWNGESGRCFLCEEAPASETEEQWVYEGRGQAEFNFKEGEIHS